jgi:deoxyribodipyrimidine photo-lyase
MTRRASKDSPAIVWFRDDLRQGNHAALSATCAAGAPVLCVYILDEASAGIRPLGAAARWWLHYSLGALAKEIEAKGGRLDLLRGRAQEIVPVLAGAAGVFSTRRYGAAEIAVDATLNGLFLHEPWEVKRADDGGFALFSPDWRAARAAPGWRSGRSASQASGPVLMVEVEQIHHIAYGGRIHRNVGVRVWQRVR